MDADPCSEESFVRVHLTTAWVITEWPSFFSASSGSFSFLFFFFFIKLPFGGLRATLGLCMVEQASAQSCVRAYRPVGVFLWPHICASPFLPWSIEMPHICPETLVYRGGPLSVYRVWAHSSSVGSAWMKEPCGYTLQRTCAPAASRVREALAELKLLTSNFFLSARALRQPFIILSNVHLVWPCV